MEDVQLDFVLVRGPENVCRRLHVSVPRTGAPVTIGRALHCGAVLDPWLVFASQVQCSVFCAPDTADSDDGRASVTEAIDIEKGTNERTKRATTPASPANTDAHTPSRPTLSNRGSTEGGASDASSGATGGSAATATPRPPAAPRLFLTDMCSSNGTFLNSVRVGPTDALPLRDGDAVIFGGMRDVAVGASLPDDAFEGPELVVWRVDVVRGKDGQTTDYPYEATPILLPSAEVLSRESHEVLSTALRSLRKGSAAPGCAGSSDAMLGVTPSPHSPLSTAARSAGGATPLSPAVPVQLFTGQTPATEARRPRAPSPAVEAAAVAPGEGCTEEGLEGARQLEREEDEQRRSGTVAARISMAVPPAVPSTETDIAAVPSALEEDDGSVASMAGDEEGEPQPLPPLEQQQSDTDFFLLLDTLESPSDAPRVTEPPATAYFHAVRVGQHTFHVPATAMLGAYMTEVTEAKDPQERSEDDEEEKEEVPASKGGKRSRGKAAAAKDKKAAAMKKVRRELPTLSERLAKLPPPPVHAITFTASHWKWVMDNPNGGSSKATLPTGLTRAAPGDAFHAMLPVTSIQSILVCHERLGLSVELRDGCQVPMIRPSVLDGAPENRWLVWMLEDCQLDSSSSGAEGNHGAGAAGKRATESKNKKATPAGTAVDFINATTTSLHERFEDWIAHMTAYYSQYKVPAPISVDPDVFDKLFAPDMLTE